MSSILNTLSAIGALAMAATPLLAVGSLAHAAEPQVRPAYVQVSGLDLARPADAAAFRSHVDAAAGDICGQDVARTRTSASACVEAVRQEAIEKLGAGQRHDLRTAQAGDDRVWSLATR